jgi:uncharacterized protein YndB with AHSA1/START domain
MPDAPPVAVVVQSMAAPAGRVFAAWLDPDMISRFMFGPLLREEDILHIRLDPNPGGTFSYKVRRDLPGAGPTDIDHVGRFLVVDAPTRLIFTWSIAPDADASTVEIDIHPEAEGSRVELRHTLAPEWADFLERTRTGWAKMLGVLNQLLAAP